MKKLDMMRAIKEHGFMAKDVADKLGITTVAMSLRTNAKNPRLDTMVQIAEIIGCDITDLFYPDPAEEAEKKEVPAGTENEGETLNTSIRGNLPEGRYHRKRREFYAAATRKRASLSGSRKRTGFRKSAADDSDFHFLPSLRKESKGGSGITKC